MMLLTLKLTEAGVGTKKVQQRHDFCCSEAMYFYNKINFDFNLGGHR